MSDPEIQRLLSSFSPIGLNEMDGVSLMNRTETKYVFASAKIPAVLDLLLPDYMVLEIDKIRAFPYHTTYLDTPDLFFYTQQIRGKLNRHKIRYRRYESSGLSFLEIKKKTNKFRTIKWRIENNLNSSVPDESAAVFIKKYLSTDFPDLRPVLINEFFRITLVGREVRERITLDFNLSFNSPEGRHSEMPFLAVAEIKRDKHSGHSPFGNIMKHMYIRPSGFSKYCIGNSLTRDVPRKNTLKRNMLLINKIQNEHLKPD